MIHQILLLDDDEIVNFLHHTVLKQLDCAEHIIVKEKAIDALEELKEMILLSKPLPELMLVDLNMPGMDGWEFLAQYNNLVNEVSQKPIVVILTTSENQDDIDKANQLSYIDGYFTKPLSAEALKEILDTYGLS